MLAVTADTNIYISALNFGGKPRELLRLSETGAFRLDISSIILAEIGEVLGGETFNWPEVEIVKAQRRIVQTANIVDPTRSISVVGEDPTDNRILECAAAAESDYLVTGDTHLLRLRKFEGILVVKVADFLSEARMGPRWR